MSEKIPKVPSSAFVPRYLDVEYMQAGLRSFCEDFFCVNSFERDNRRLKTVDRLHEMAARYKTASTGNSNLSTAHITQGTIRYKSTLKSIGFGWARILLSILTPIPILN